MLNRRRLDQHDVALLRQHDEVIAGEQHLAVAVSSGLPLELARPGIEARENRFVEAVEVPLVQDRARELVLHPRVLPERPVATNVRRRVSARTRRRPGRSPPRKHAIVAKHDRLRDVDAVVVGHGYSQSSRPPSGVMPTARDEVTVKDLADASERHQHRRHIGLLVIQRLPADVSGRGCRTRPPTGLDVRRAARRPCRRR